MRAPSPTPTKPRVAIVGAGFAGLEAARGLAGAAVEVTLIDRHNYHLFQPLLYQVATAGLTPEDIAHPVRAILRRQRNLAFRQAEVTGFDLAAKRVITSTGEVPYDYLLLAAGSDTNYFGLTSVAENGFGLKTIDEAVAVRNHVLGMFEQASQEDDPVKRRTMLTFIVVGGGPTGVELAGALSELVYTVLVKDYPRLDFSEARIVLLQATDSLLPNLPQDLRDVTAETLRKKKVEVEFGQTVTGYDGQTITLKNGESLSARSLIWAAGVRASRLVDGLGVSQGSLGRAVVLPTLQLAGHPEVFVAGDAAHIDENGRPLPMTAVVALQSGSKAAGNIQRLLCGQQPETFLFHDLGSLATIGRNAAVGQIGRVKIKGLLAWLLWTVVHIVRLVGFRNRLFVFWSWFWDYILYDRSIRLITRE